MTTLTYRPESVPWRDKAQRLIAESCRASYLAANMLPTGQFRRKHVPYAVPELAQTLIDCLNRDDELTAKALFMRLSIVGKLEYV